MCEQAGAFISRTFVFPSFLLEKNYRIKKLFALKNEAATRKNGFGILTNKIETILGRRKISETLVS